MCRMFRLLKADEIDCRIGQIKENGLSLLLYKDARADMNVLDETVGAMNWKRSHLRDNANCVVSIFDKEKGEWISKEDTGVESNTEAEKGLASDSFKRACVNWGIGRELYTAPFIWIPADKCEIKAATNGRRYCNTRFSVKRIEYQEDRISYLEIADGKGSIVYSMGYSRPEAPKKEELVCQMCGKKITGAKKKDGSMMTAEEVVVSSMAQFGQKLCIPCVRLRSKT